MKKPSIGGLRRSSRLLAALRGEAQSPSPVWFMRQAGRYLPEYRALRSRAGSFLDLCFNPELATEVTLQPVRRFDLDAAILFSDILVIPHALGQRVTFVENEGPKLDPPLTAGSLKSLRREKIVDALSPVLETVRKTRAALGDDKALIGFAGAPWTVATYMLNGGASADPAGLRAHFYRDRAFITGLLDLLVEATAAYLVAQTEAGADALQIFDSWAGGLPEEAARALSLEPMRRVAAAVKAQANVPIIAFPKGVGPLAADYARAPEFDAIGIDFATPWGWARENLSPHAVVQGGLDPILVIEGGAPMEEAARRLLRTFDGLPYIFNLGHGLTPQTPPEHVAQLVRCVRER